MAPRPSDGEDEASELLERDLRGVELRAYNIGAERRVVGDDQDRGLPESAAAAVRAIVGVQRALRADVSRATEVGEKLFPPGDAAMIAAVVERDLPHYTPHISERFVATMNDFMQALDWLPGPVPYPQVVATELVAEWDGTPGKETGP